MSENVKDQTSEDVENKELQEILIEDFDIDISKKRILEIKSSYEGAVAEAREGIGQAVEKMKAISETNFFNDAVNIFKNFEKNIYLVFETAGTASIDELRKERLDVVKMISEKSALDDDTELESFKNEIDIVIDTLHKEVMIAGKEYEMLKIAYKNEKEGGKYVDIPGLGDYLLEDNKNNLDESENRPEKVIVSGEAHDHDSVEKNIITGMSSKQKESFSDVKNIDELFSRIKDLGIIYDDKGKIRDIKLLIKNLEAIRSGNKTKKSLPRNINFLRELFKNLLKNENKGEKNNDNSEEDIVLSNSEFDQEKIDIKLTSELIKNVIHSGRFIRVKVKRSSGDVEDGWSISGIDNGRASLFKNIDNNQVLTRTASLDDLYEVNDVIDTKGESAFSETPVAEIEGIINNAKSIGELARTIREKHLTIKNDGQIITPYELMDILINYRSLDEVPSVYGLRDKIEELSIKFNEEISEESNVEKELDMEDENSDENYYPEDDFLGMLESQERDLEAYDVSELEKEKIIGEEIANLETKTQEEESLKQELLKMPLNEEKRFFEGLANLGYRSNELKSKVFKKFYGVLASLSQDSKTLNNYFTNFSDIYGKLENSSKKKREEVGKSGLSQGIGIGQGVGNILKYGRIIADYGFANPLRTFTAASMFAARASEAGKEARFDSLQQKNERNELSKEDEELLSEEAYNEAFDVYNSLKEKSTKEQLSAQDLEDYYITEVPDSLKNRLDELSKVDNAGVSWMAKQLNKQSANYVEKIQKQIKDVESSNISEEEKGLVIKNIFRKNNIKLKELDRMVSDQGFVDSVAYTAKIAEKSGKTIANLLMLDTGYKLFKTGFNIFSDLDLTENMAGKKIPIDHSGRKISIPDRSSTTGLDNIDTASSEINSNSKDVSETETEAISIENAPMAYLDDFKLPETSHEVVKGDSVWEISKSILVGNPVYENLAEGQKTYVIDSIKDVLAEQANEKGFIMEGDSIEFDKLNSDDINRAILEAQGMDSETIKQVEKNNQIFRDYFKENPNAPRTVQNYEAILKGNSSTDEGSDLDNQVIEKITEENRVDVLEKNNNFEDHFFVGNVKEDVGTRINKIYNQGSYFRDQKEEWSDNKNLLAKDVLAGKYIYEDRKDLKIIDDFASNSESGELKYKGNPEKFLGNQIDQVELNNRKELTIYVNEIKENFELPNKGETVEEYLNRYENNIASSVTDVSADDLAIAEQVGSVAGILEESAGEVAVEDVKYIESFKDLNESSREALMEIRNGKEPDFNLINKMLNGNLKEYVDNFPGEGNPDIYIERKISEVVVHLDNNDNKFISINDNGNIIASKGDLERWPSGDENRHVSDKNIKEVFAFFENKTESEMAQEANKTDDASVNKIKTEEIDNHLDYYEIKSEILPSGVEFEASDEVRDVLKDRKLEIVDGKMIVGKLEMSFISDTGDDGITKKIIFTKSGEDLIVKTIDDDGSVDSLLIKPNNEVVPIKGINSNTDDNMHIDKKSNAKEEGINIFEKDSGSVNNEGVSILE